ncbi:MAG TPA: branched-chain amino acid ABC transporter permease [Candidatus Bathyarchaeia archaeon]|nr:branched-chain amino acid ABC transporter permease [Candidatus Bathyarchaeia archaeon]
MLAQLIVSGIAQGVLYALVALSMTMLYRATTVVNFGHGDLVMGGAFAVYVFVVYAHLPYLAGALIALALLFCVGLAIHQGLMRRILTGPHLTIAMMALAVGYGLRGGARMLWGREVLPFPRIFPDHAWTIGNVVVTSDNVIVSGTVLGLMAVLAVLFNVTRVGRLLQAVFQSQRGAALIGLNVNAVHAIVWGAAAALAALGGVLLAPITLLYPDMGVWVLVRGFAAMTLGGFGSLPGAVLGGVILGVMELVLGAYLSTAFIDISAYVIVIAVLLLRPDGLFGRHAVVRV